MAPFVAAWADATLFWVAVISTQAPEARAKIFQGLIAGQIQHLRDDRIAFTAAVRRPNSPARRGPPAVRGPDARAGARRLRRGPGRVAAARGRRGLGARCAHRRIGRRADAGHRPRRGHTRRRPAAGPGVPVWRRPGHRQPPKPRPPVCRSLANQARLCIVAVDCRLAPEHPFPTALDDSAAARQWVVALMGRDGTLPRPIHQTLIYRWSIQRAQRLVPQGHLGCAADRADDALLHRPLHTQRAGPARLARIAGDGRHLA